MIASNNESGVEERALELKIASANLEHWIKGGGVMVGGGVRSQKDFDTKLAWAKALFGASKPDIVAMQEVYDTTIEEAFTGLGYTFKYSGGAQQQVAIASKLPFVADPDGFVAIQNLAVPITINRAGLTLSVDKLSRPIILARLVHEGEIITVFVTHLKSKIPSYGDDPTKTYAEEDLATADFGARPLGNLVSLARRAAEATALRQLIVDEATKFPDRPIIACGDFNDDTGAVTTDMVCGDSMRTFIENKPQLTDAELQKIYGRLHQYLMTSSQSAFARTSEFSAFFSAIHEGRFSTLDHILLSRHFFPKPRVLKGNFDQKYYFNHHEVANDHLVDDASEFPPRKPETSDHGVVFAMTRKVKAAVPPGPQPPAGPDADNALKQPTDLLPI